MYEKTDTCEEEITVIIEHLDHSIKTWAKKKLPQVNIMAGEFCTESDEIVQRTRIKLWSALKRGHIKNPTGYAYSIVSSEVVDMQRRARPTIPFSQLISEPSYNERISDPGQRIDQLETLKNTVLHILRVIQQLPERQQQAIICALKDAQEDAGPLLLALQASGINIHDIHWPQDLASMRSMRSSLSISRKKLRKALQQGED